MYSFNNDYSEGACEAIMRALAESNFTQSAGYGLDEISEEARRLIKKQLECSSCDIHFLVGGTQCNQIVIASMLRPFEAVIAAESGHINVHESGAIETTGHKVVVASSVQGKLSAQGIREVMEAHNDEHMVKPAMVYISNATEIGTVYTRSDLQELRSVCDEYGLYLYMDGARLPMALVAEANDLCLADLQRYFDICYLGGTKCGALFGEAVVIFNDRLKPDFRYSIKQRGALLAKGRLLGIQFRELFRDDLYLNLAKHAVAMAQKLQDGMKELGISFYTESTTNQIFPIVDQALMEALDGVVQYQYWGRQGEHHHILRFVTSWATPTQAVDDCLTWLRQYHQTHSHI